MSPHPRAQILRSVALGGLSLAACAAVTLSVASPPAGAETVAAAAYGPTTATCNISVTASTVRLGAPLTIAGNCGVAGDPLQLSLGTTSLGHYTAGAGGTYQVTATVPATVGIGRRTITATNMTHHATATTDVMVLQAGQIAPDPASAVGRADAHGSLAFTGTNVGAMTVVGATAVSLGGIVVLASRRRRPHRFTR